MAQKNATPNSKQAAYIRRSGRDPLDYTVIRELTNSLVVMHRPTKIVVIIQKR